MALNLRNMNEEQVEDVKEVVAEELGTAVNQLKNMFNDSGLKKGHTYLFRTVTMINVGKVKRVTPRFVILTNASWIADTGRFEISLSDPDEFKEIEVFPNDLTLSLRAIIDFTEWPHELPKAQQT